MTIGIEHVNDYPLIRCEIRFERSWQQHWVKAYTLLRGSKYGDESRKIGKSPAGQCFIQHQTLRSWRTVGWRKCWTRVTVRRSNLNACPRAAASFGRRQCCSARKIIRFTTVTRGRLDGCENRFNTRTHAASLRIRQTAPVSLVRLQFATRRHQPLNGSDSRPT